ASNPAAMCPADYSIVPRGQLCGTFASYCDYPQGRCACSFPPGPPSPTPKWFCQDPQPGCPMPRARLGTKCTSEGMACDYAPCTVAGVSQICRSGIWVQAVGGCPFDFGEE